MQELEQQKIYVLKTYQTNADNLLGGKQQRYKGLRNWRKI